MPKCCICGIELEDKVLWACGSCCAKYALALATNRWPAWARSELEREQKRRRFEPSYGVSGAALQYAPYHRGHENTTYRKVNRVSKRAAPARKRVSADDLFYSSTDGAEPGRTYDGLLERLPSDTREQLLQHAELRVLLDDAIRSLPLISQRALRGVAQGYSTATLAAQEGVAESTLAWLLDEAKQRLADILLDKLGADDGARYS